jgi:Metallo-beta-lactamase superfamily
MATKPKAAKTLRTRASAKKTAARKTSARPRGGQSAGPSAQPSAESGARPKSGGSAPRASVRVYRQGLGDCILVRVKRDKGDDFKMLIDCGVVLGTQNPAPIMARVVDNIVAETNKTIDVLAITHEHWDHLSGFIQAADSFKKLTAGEVWAAWTEDPKDPLAAQLKQQLGKAKAALAACATALRMGGQDDTADMLADLALSPLGAAGADTSTSAAFDRAKGMAGNKPLRLCKPSNDPIGIDGANARIYVLGPPHDSALIHKINPSGSHPETYALALDGGGVLPLGVAAALGLAEGGDAGAPFHQRVSIPLDLKDRPSFFNEHYDGKDDDWRRIDGDWLGAAADFALALQSYTNNTSLVLALELGDPSKGEVLLFAGDAQVGNWESWQACKWTEGSSLVTGPDLLSRAIFYKVGHHGSHNATMKAHGLEEMVALKAAIIPVDEVEAKKKRWGRMPLPELIDALSGKLKDGPLLRTDQTPTGHWDNVAVADDYFEISF